LKKEPRNALLFKGIEPCSHGLATGQYPLQAQTQSSGSSKHITWVFQCISTSASQPQFCTSLSLLSSFPCVLLYLPKSTSLV